MAAICGKRKFFENCQEYIAQIPCGSKISTKSLSHGLGDMSTFAFFSIQNSQLLIYLINYSLIYEAIPPKSNAIQLVACVRRGKYRFSKLSVSCPFLDVNPTINHNNSSPNPNNSSFSSYTF